MEQDTLYISDLDGTLFNSRKEITGYSASVINRCIARGMQFTVATARMPYGCDYRLKELDLRTPAILTNGVFLYDFRKKEYLHAETIARQAAESVAEAFRENGMDYFLYLFADGGIRLYYGSEELKGQTQYYSERALEECISVEQTDDPAKRMDLGEPFYFARTGTKEELEPVRRRIEEIEEVSCAFYLNIYNGLYCLEVYSARASKKNALLRLKEMLGCRELVVFGDNYNDVPMIEIADRSYAPANALEEIRAMADRVLEDCDHDGVAKFLQEEAAI